MGRGGEYLFTILRKHNFIFFFTLLQFPHIPSIVNSLLKRIEKSQNTKSLFSEEEGKGGRTTFFIL